MTSYHEAIPPAPPAMPPDDDPRTVFLRLIRAAAQAARVCLENGIAVEWVRTELVARGLEGFEPDNPAVDRHRPDLVALRDHLRRAVDRTIFEFHQLSPEG